MAKQTIGGFISALRKANSMTQKELAEKLNVSDKAVSRWENGDSYPDLMLIPVIAEIFKVTADELLSGERRKDENKSAESSYKSIELLLKHSLSSYKNKTVISLGIAFFGLALAFAINFGALRSVLAFSLAALTFVVSSVCHTFFTNQAFSAINSFDENTKLISDYKQKIKGKAFLIYCIILSVLLFCIPLAVAGDVHSGLDFMTWVYPGAAITLIYYIILTVVNSVFCLKSAKLVFSDTQRHNAKLKIRIISVWCFAVILTIISMLALNNNFMYVKGTEFQTQDEFVEFMKNYKSENEIIEFVDGEEFENEVHDYNGKLLFSYPMNGNIAVVNFNKNNDGKTAESFFPCRAYTAEDLIQRGSIVDGINIGFIVVYAFEAVLPFIIYNRKKQK